MAHRITLVHGPLDGSDLDIPTSLYPQPPEALALPLPDGDKLAVYARTDTIGNDRRILYLFDVIADEPSFGHRS